MEDKNPYEMEAVIDIPKTKFENVFADEEIVIDVLKEVNNIPNLSGEVRTEEEWSNILSFKEKSLSSSLRYDSAKTISLENKLIFLRDEIKDIQVKNISVACTYFENLNLDTKNKLKEISVTSDRLIEELLSYANSWYNELDSIIANLETRQKSNEEINTNNGGSRKGTYSTIHIGSQSSTSTSSPSNSTNQPIQDVEVGTGNSSISLLNAIVGLITFTEIIPLYEQIGSSSNISASLTSNYGLIGVEKRDGVYYYKLLDTKTNKVYYVKFNDKVKIEVNVKNLIELKENTMMLNSTEIGTNNFVKLTDANTLYFVQDTVENQGITFYSVLDGSDGNSYYIPQGDEVLLTTLDEISEKISGDN